MSKIRPDTSPEARRALLNATWELTDRRIVAEVVQRGTLAQTHLTEDDIARIALEMTADTS
ncbi:MAG TPA: hypothetical protein VGO40_16860 [Longimicrobium sp.]|nr:hypothetical protein [Longimicrobium sp.]